MMLFKKEDIYKMRFWIFMFIITLLIPFSLLLVWYIFPKFKKINQMSGYRSSRSMKNQDTWSFAQNYCSKLSLKLFFPTLLLALIIIPFSINKSIDIVGFIGLAITIVQMMNFFVIFYLTEKALKENF